MAACESNSSFERNFLRIFSFFVRRIFCVAQHLCFFWVYHSRPRTIPQGNFATRNGYFCMCIKRDFFFLLGDTLFYKYKHGCELPYHIVRRIYACTTCMYTTINYTCHQHDITLADNAPSQLTFSLYMNKSFPVTSWQGSFKVSAKA